MGQKLHIIANIKTDFPTKFGLPRQGSFAGSLVGKIVFRPEYRRREALRGIEEYSHLWLIWGFSEVRRDKWIPTVKPPRLGGKIHKGVFATRSPFRPNPLGLTCVKLEKVDYEDDNGPVLIVSGIDMMDQSPIYDIKPYIPYADAFPDAKSSFGGIQKDKVLSVQFSDQYLQILPEEKRSGAIEMLKQDPRPAYHNHKEQIYKIAYAGYDIHFTVDGETLDVCNVFPLDKGVYKNDRKSSPQKAD